MQYIAFDSHKKYTFVSVANPDGGIQKEGRLEHRRGAVTQGLAAWDPGSPVAVETIGNWYWIVDEIEAAGMVPQLVHARKAKVMMGMINKTDKLDARGLNRLQRAGTLPTVWIPSGRLRDQRELPRTRMVFSQIRTRLKNRIHATLAKYALQDAAVKDVFGVAGRRWLETQLPALPPHTQATTQRLLQELDGVAAQIAWFDTQIHTHFAETPALTLVRSVPGVGWILGIVILLEVGDVTRFPSPQHLASYAGTTPRVHSSGGKTRMGRLRSDVNRYLKWAYAEAANAVCTKRSVYPDRHVSHVYQRIKAQKGHAKAIGAVMRHLAEATYWILTKQEGYHDPHVQTRSSRKDQRGNVMSP